MPAPFDKLPLTPVGAPTRIAPLERSADPRQEAMARALKPMLGQSLRAEVLARLSDGGALVRVAGHAARMQLPASLPAGSQVDMTLVAVSPRPAFQLDKTNPALITAYAAPLPGGADAPDAPGAPHGANGAQPSLRALQAAALFGSQQLAGAAPHPSDADGSPIQLSETARVLAGVLAAALKAPQRNSAIVARAPLLPGPDAPPERVAAALGDALANSGLFYESHVAEWAGGKRSLPDLMREPQMQRALAAPEPAPHKPAAAIDPAAAQLVNLQLNTQEQARVAWHGEVWPGQYMEWDVRKEEPEHRGAPGDEDGGEAAVWRSAVRFRLPLLGEVGGSLVLASERLHIRLQTDNEAARALLRGHAGALGAALEAAGSPLGSFEVGACAPPAGIVQADGRQADG